MPESRADRERLIVENLGLVHACAGRFRGKGIEYDDLVQSGSIGLIKAADRFDPSRGFAFSTFAVPLILGEMRALFRQGSAVKIGRTTRENARRAAECGNTLAEALGRQPTVSELAQALGCDTAQAALWIGAAAAPVSLDALDVPDAALSAPSPENQLTDRLALRQLIARLPAADQTLLRMRYLRGCTQTVTANALGMTQVQVSRREKKLLLLLRDQIGD